MRGNCPHCHQADLIKDNWYDRNAVKCPACGKWYGEMPKIKFPMSVDEWKGKPCLKHTPKEDKRYKPCPVVGCSRKMLLSNKGEMCAECKRALRNWKEGSRRDAPPLIFTPEGLWMKNERVAA